jgi:hypothetical protein
LHQRQETSLVSSPIFAVPIGVEQLRSWPEFGLVRIADAGNFLQEILKVGLLGEAGELASAMESNINALFYSRFLEKAEKLFGRLPRETDGAKKDFHRIKGIRGLRKMRGKQTPGLGGVARPGEPHHVRK